MKAAIPFKRALKKLARGQGLVELALVFPVLLIMLSGLLEFGFVLNEYLDLLDGAREAARFASDAEPFITPGVDDPTFYTNAAMLAEQTMSPLTLDPTQDDVVISVFSVDGGGVSARYPSPGGQWQLHGNDTSKFSNGDINARLQALSPNTGIVLVEVFYAYNQKFKLPWITVFVPDPIEVHTFTIMPLVAAEPTATPIP